MVWWTQMFHSEDLCFLFFCSRSKKNIHDRNHGRRPRPRLCYMCDVSSLLLSVSTFTQSQPMWQFWKATRASFTHELWSFLGQSDQSSMRLSDCPAFWQTFHFSFWNFLWNKHDIKIKHVTRGMSATQAAGMHAFLLFTVRDWTETDTVLKRSSEFVSWLVRPWLDSS